MSINRPTFEAGRRAFALFALAASALISFSFYPASAVAQGGEPYSEPDFTKRIFAREALLLERQEIASTVNALTALASNFPGAEEVDHRLRGKALAIALRLNGADPKAIAANVQLRGGAIPVAVSDFNTLDEVAQQLWTTASYLETAEKNKDERVLQFCLVDIAREIDPSNLSDSNSYPTRLPESTFAGWKTILSGAEGFVFPDNKTGTKPDPDPVVPDKAVDPVLPEVIPTVPDNPTRTALGKYSSIVISGDDASVARISGDLKVGGGTAPLAIIFADGEGNTSLALNGNRESLTAALTKAQGSWPQDGGVLVLSIATANGGDNALLLPSALLADSLIRERKLDPRTVALGIVAPDGSLAPVDRLYQRLQTLRSNNIDTIIVPADNLPELQDMLLLDELETFFRFQIILVDTLEKAIVYAAVERPEHITKSQRDFKLVQVVAKDSDSKLEDMTGYTVVKDSLDKTARLNPDHGSAKLLLEHGTRKLPKHLTRKGSLAALYRATGPVVTAMKSKDHPERATVLAAYESVTKIQAILEPGTTELGTMMTGVLKDIGGYVSLESKTSAQAVELKAKIFSTWDTVRQEYGRLKNG